jgi:hypothetical protein
MKSIIIVVLAASLAAMPSAAQTASELLQKGIYTQDTVGDADAAIQLFRQAFSAAGTERDLAAQAQYRLVQALLRKGDTATAALEMNRLAQEFPDQRELISRLASGPAGPDGFRLVAIPAPQLAAEFDQSRAVTVQGNVTRIDWINPHSWIWVKDSGGAEWAIQLPAPNQLLKQNFTRASFKPGDSATVTANPAKDGSKAGAALTVVRQSDQTTLFDRNLLPVADPAPAKQ